MFRCEKVFYLCRENHKSFEDLDTSELDALSQLSPHPNLARILDTVWNISSGGVELFLVTERCAGGDLAKFIEDHGAFTEIMVSKYAILPELEKE